MMPKRSHISLFLIITVLCFSLYAHTAQAGFFNDVGNFFSNAASQVVEHVIKPVVAAVALTALTFSPIGFIVTLVNLAAPGSITGLDQTRSALGCYGFGVSNVFTGQGCRDQGGTIVIGNPPPLLPTNPSSGSCPSEIKFLNMPIPSNIRYFGPGDYFENQARLSEFDNPSSSLTVFRYVLPAKDSRGVITTDKVFNNWYGDIIRNRISRGIVSFRDANIFLMVGGSSVGSYYGLDSFYGTSSPTVYAKVPLGGACARDNTCKFIDGNLPTDSFVAYIIQLNGHYYQMKKSTRYDGTEYYYIDFIDGGANGMTNKFMPVKEPINKVTFPVVSYSDPYGYYLNESQVDFEAHNGIALFKTPDYCPPPPPQPPTPPSLPPIIFTSSDVCLNGSCGAGESTPASCGTVNISLKAQNANTYIIYRNNVKIKEGPLSAIGNAIVTDTGLESHTTYSYKVTVKNTIGTIAEVSKTVTNSCKPRCELTSDIEAIPKFGTVNLSWQCGIGSPAALADSCAIDARDSKTQTLSNLIKSGRGDHGTLRLINIDKSTTYQLSCKNIDGAAPLSTKQIRVEEPVFKEVSPGTR